VNRDTGVARHYRLYGLTVRTTLPLTPEAEVTPDGPADLAVSFHPASPGRMNLPESMKWTQTSHGARLTYVAGTHRLDFAFDAPARNLTIRSTRPETIASVADLFVGPGMVAALHLRGSHVFHGSAVRVRDRAVLCLGAAGSGKSTLTVALVAAGAPLLAEEVVAVDAGSHGMTVRSGHPDIGLLPASLATLDARIARRPVLPHFAADGKCVVSASAFPGGFSRTPAPLGAVYLLASQFSGVSCAIEPCSPARAIPALMSHLYGRRWLGSPADAFSWCAAVADRVPICHVTLAEGLDHVHLAALTLCRDAESRLGS
jgi:hypothetical protein